MELAKDLEQRNGWRRTRRIVVGLMTGTLGNSSVEEDRRKGMTLGKECMWSEFNLVSRPRVLCQVSMLSVRGTRVVFKRPFLTKSS